MNKKREQHFLEYTQYIEDHTLRCEVSHRGGGIEIDISELTGIEEAKMTAFQNYLGGGIAGSIKTSLNVDQILTKKQEKIIDDMAEVLKRYFYSLNNGGGDEYMQENYNSFEHNQNMPVSGY